MRLTEKDDLGHWFLKGLEWGQLREGKDIINGPKPTTWSSRMPAYAGTSLCPDPELRGGDTIGEDKDNQEASEQLPKA